MKSLQSVCLFCGARSGRRPVWVEATQRMARLLAQQQVTIIYGGGHAGLMGVVADTALSEGGRVEGVIPEGLKDRELAHLGLSELHVVKTMHQRKALMEVLSEAVITLPGGFGTLDEFFEILTWRQLGIHRKPIGLLNTQGYFDPLLDFCKRAVDEDFVSVEDYEKIIVESEPEALWDRLTLSCK